jgi:hypothetical protein
LGNNNDFVIVLSSSSAMECKIEANFRFFEPMGLILMQKLVTHSEEMLYTYPREMALFSGIMNENLV